MIYKPALIVGLICIIGGFCGLYFLNSNLESYIASHPNATLGDTAPTVQAETFILIIQAAGVYLVYISRFIYQGGKRGT